MNLPRDKNRIIKGINQSVSQSVSPPHQPNKSVKHKTARRASSQFLLELHSFQPSTCAIQAHQKTCIPFFSFLGPFVFAFLISRKRQLLRDSETGASELSKACHGSPHHPLPISHFSTKEKHTKNQKKELKLTCRELKFPMEKKHRVSQHNGFSPIASPSPHVVMSTMEASSFPTQGV